MRGSWFGFAGLAAIVLACTLIPACQKPVYSTKRVAGFTSECNLVAEDGSICTMMVGCRSTFSIPMGTPFLCAWH